MLYEQQTLLIVVWTFDCITTGINSYLKNVDLHFSSFIGRL